MRSSSALIITEYYLKVQGIISKVDGVVTAEDVVALENLYNLRTSSDTIKGYIVATRGNKKAATISKEFKVNGYLSTDNMVRLPIKSDSSPGDFSNDAYVETECGMSWALMMQAVLEYNKTAAEVDKLELNRFKAENDDAGNRSYHMQVEAYFAERVARYKAWTVSNASNPFFSKGRASVEEALLESNRSTNTNANNTYAESWIMAHINNVYDTAWNKVPDEETTTTPQKTGDLIGYGGSPHGWGRAIDFDVNDDGSEDNGQGYALTKAVIWLENNAEEFGFTPYLKDDDDDDGVKGKIEKSPGVWVNNYKETWHWNYNPLGLNGK